jgi:hypothetical protein
VQGGEAGPGIGVPMPGYAFWHAAMFGDKGQWNA